MDNNTNPTESTTMIQAEAKASYLDFEPYCAWQREEESDTLAVHLPGFKKDQMRVQVNNHRILTIHGQRPLDAGEDNTWTRFSKQIKLPDNCDENRITVEFVSGVLSITMRKKDQSTTEKVRDDQETTGSKDIANNKEKRRGNCVIKRIADRESDSVGGLWTMAGKIAAVVLVIVFSGACVHACMFRKPTMCNFRK